MHATQGLTEDKKEWVLTEVHYVSGGGDLCTTATCWQPCTVVLGHAQGQHLDSMMCFLACLGVWQLGVVGWLAADHWSGCAVYMPRWAPIASSCCGDRPVFVCCWGASNRDAGQVGQGCKLVGVITSDCVHRWWQTCCLICTIAVQYDGKSLKTIHALLCGLHRVRVCLLGELSY